ncbi:MAG: GEVED domain-containing protein [Sphingobacteriales bacterium JAD_PAG50586_3]|nr:MAG: GEVED domain-containing protein [Sphingobacteriales bacterium JAD_PAG50586_3]
MGTVLNAQTYCTPTVGTPCAGNEYISNFALNTINNPSACGLGYNDFSGSISTTLTAGVAATATVTVGNSFAGDAVELWIDLNSDGDFTDAGELILNAVAVSSGSASGTVTIPAGTTAGSKRLRVALRYGPSNGLGNSCGAYSFGEFEDYTVNVVYPSFGGTCGLGVAIADNSCSTTVSIPVSGIGILNGGTTLESVEINITHPFDGDLDVSLTSPSGTVVDLTSDNGGTGDNYGTAACAQNTRFIMSAATLVTAGTAPFAGDYEPEGDLGTYYTNSDNANGNWILTVCDDASIDVGTLNLVKLNFGAYVPPPPPPVIDAFQTACTVNVAIPDGTCPNSTLVAVPVSGISTTLSATPAP